MSSARKWLWVGLGVVILVINMLAFPAEGRGFVGPLPTNVFLTWLIGWGTVVFFAWYMWDIMART